ncbi:3-isopropylmalate dehydratase small subunit [Candidatus Sumerlaeota bacterium]|nr:3-isopropylmalate dehydratase small subunit [Candidatus Sumerlaeota bacterium]
MKRVKISGRAVSVRGNDIDTDRIIPARYLRCVTFEGLGDHAFEDDRKQLALQGKTHPLDNPHFASATVLFGNKNFGCGSSREHAPQAIMRWGDGIQAIVGESFAEIFFGNCIALGIPCLTVSAVDIAQLMAQNEADPKTEFTVDLEAMEVRWDGGCVKAQLADGPRSQFLEGKWDTTAELMEDPGAIAATAANLPYFNHWK